MRPLAVLAGIILAVTIASPDLRAQREYTLFASFIDATTGQPIMTMTPGQIEIREDDVLCRVVRMEPIDWPVRVELLIDNGAGTGSTNLMHLRNGLRSFVEALPPGIEATVITTAPQPRTLVAATSDRQRLLRGAGLLTPDEAMGRFFDALNETATRIQRALDSKDRKNFFPVVVALASTTGDASTFVERDIERLLLRYQLNSSTVHVIMLSSTSQLAGGHAAQAGLGLAITQATGGRYENIAAATRIPSLLGEVAQQIANSHARQTKQFRIAYERPAGKSGRLEKVTVSGPAGLAIQLSTDGRLPQ